ncbi:hypothetical protein EV127DRAFT_150211 [Xylaria flabelliformis]|nr:hypothetical protein EV127DRAFT_150211 [Xylaria flabelliformis]
MRGIHYIAFAASIFILFPNSVFIHPFPYQTSHHCCRSLDHVSALLDESTPRGLESFLLYRSIRSLIQVPSSLKAVRASPTPCSTR